MTDFHWTHEANRWRSKICLIRSSADSLLNCWTCVKQVFRLCLKSAICLFKQLINFWKEELVARYSFINFHVLTKRACPDLRCKIAWSILRRSKSLKSAWARVIWTRRPGSKWPQAFAILFRLKCFPPNVAHYLGCSISNKSVKMSNYEVIFDDITKTCHAKFRILYHKIYQLKGHD